MPTTGSKQPVPEEPTPSLALGCQKTQNDVKAMHKQRENWCEIM